MVALMWFLEVPRLLWCHAVLCRAQQVRSQGQAADHANNRHMDTLIDHGGITCYVVLCHDVLCCAVQGASQGQAADNAINRVSDTWAP